MSVRGFLQSIGRRADDDIDLSAAALALSAWSEPGLDLMPYRRHLDALRHDVIAYVHHDDAGARLAAEAVRQVLHKRYGYAALLERDIPSEGALLTRVIDKRRGHALALAVLYRHALGGLDVSADIIDFPARALLRIDDSRGQRLVIDPWDGGRVLDARGMRALVREARGGANGLDPFRLRTFANRDVLVALLDHLKTQHLRHAAPEAALAALEGALLVAPQNARLWREAGLLHARLDHIGDAISALTRFLDLPGSDVHRYTASQMLQQLQSRLDRTES